MNHTVPSYRRQKRKNGRDLAFVVLDGQRCYLGEHGSSASKEAYQRQLAEWLGRGRQLPTTPNSITIFEVIARFWNHAEIHYRKPDGTPTSEPHNFRMALKPLKELYGESFAVDFGPVALKAVRAHLIDKGWSRNFINKSIGRIKRMFRWAAENEIVHPEIYHRLQIVSGLQRGRCEAREPQPVRPVPVWLVEKTLPHLTPTLRAMVSLQLLTGMRPGEVCILRGCDINTTDDVWVYRPSTHKTEHHGSDRQVYLGPKAIEIVRPFCVENPGTYLFSPKHSEEQRLKAAHANRTTPLNQGNAPGTNRRHQSSRSPGEKYDTISYRRAIVYACDRTFPLPKEIHGDTEKIRIWRRRHRWSPGRLRHNYATSMRQQFGLDAAQLMLGHSRADVTQVYAEVNQSRAQELARVTG